MTGRLVLTWLLGGVAALDSTPVGQTLLSQPLVTATALGALWGDWQTALEVGIVLQVLAASTLPVGARTPEDYATGGVIGTGLALVLAAQQPFEMTRAASALIGVLAGLLAATLGVPALKWQRRRNEALSRWCEAELLAGNERALAAAQTAGVVLSFGVGVGFTALALGLGARVLQGVVNHHSMPLSHAWTLAQPLWLGLGLAQLLHAFMQRRLTRAAVFAVALLGTWLFLLVRTP
jgi:mannose/fructose/N-acetylgalactosamine-specific phosphotransferase system component IIC